MKTNKTSGPMKGLVLLFSLLMLSMTCLAAYLLLPREEFQGQQKAMADVMKRDEVTFLGKGFYMDTVDPDHTPQELFNMQPYGSDMEYISENKILLQVYADGIIVGQDNADWLNFTEHRLYIKWWGNQAYLVCNNYPELTKKFTVSTYNIDNLDGDAEAVGTIGTPFQDSQGTQAAFDALHLETVGYMRIYQPTGEYNLTGKTQYLIEMATEPQLQPTALAYHQDWKIQASKLLGIAFLLLLVLYWFLLPLWVWFDARRRHARPAGWASAVLLTNAVGLAVYLAIQARRDKKHSTLPCPACGKTVLMSYPTSPWCAAALLQPCPLCGRVQQREWIACPWCTEAKAEPLAEPETRAETVITAPDIEAQADAAEANDETGQSLPLMLREDENRWKQDSDEN